MKKIEKRRKDVILSLSKYGMERKQLTNTKYQRPKSNYQDKSLLC